MRRSGVLVAFTLLVLALPVGADGAGGRTSAHAARSLNIADVGHLHLLKSSGSHLIEEGATSGKVPGNMKANLEVGAAFSGTFTIYTHGGSISGHGSASPHGSGRFESFSGSAVITHGTGRYAHIHGHAGLFGTFDRRTYGFVFQTTGTLSY